MQKLYDVIVVGAGGVGAAALWRLARRGVAVLGIDRFAPPHEMGSSHGQTRIIRQAYFEHPDYVPLARASYRLWDDLAAETGNELYRATGLLEVGPEQGKVVPGVLRSAAEHHLEVQRLTSSEIQRRWPALHVPEGCVGVFEPQAGYLRVEACVGASLAAARRAAALLTDTEVVGWRSDGASVVVETCRGEFQTARLVVTAGPWAGTLLQQTGVSLQVLRKPVAWFAGEHASLGVDAGMPCFLYEFQRGVFYGFPTLDSRGLKAAEHSGGQPAATVETVDRQWHPQDEAPLKAFLRQCVPDAGPWLEGNVCLYTMSRDGHFIVDRLPQDDRVCFAAGLSGHGFKFAPVLGEMLAQFALDSPSSLPGRFLSLAQRKL